MSESGEERSEPTGRELVVADNTSKINDMNNSYAKKRGFTGLDNLGNTCFMNAVIQCLSNTDPFRDYFLSDQYVQDINKTNPLGTGGAIASAFANLLHQLWLGKQSSVPPQRLKAIISESVAQQFSGFAQHDAQELMAFLLDALHEDLNRIAEKPYIAVNNENSGNVADEVLADEAWKRYRMRNDSIVVDLFQGQYKSKLTCPICGKISITFDPILYLSVPFPMPPISHEIFFFPRDPSTGMSRHKPVKYTIKLQHDALVKHLLERMSEVTGVHVKKFRLIQATNHGISKFHQHNWKISDYRHDESLLLFEILSVDSEDVSGDSVVKDIIEFAVVQRLSTPPKPDNCTKCDKNEGWDNVSLKRCMKCLRAAYCDKTCQSEDHAVHKKSCIYRPEPVGLPFIISLPKSQLTYRNLCAIVYSYARHSVEFPQRRFEDNQNTIGGKHFTLNLNEFPIPPPFKLRLNRDLKSNEEGDELLKLALKRRINEEDTGGDNMDVDFDNIFDTPLNLESYYLALDWNNPVKPSDANENSFIEVSNWLLSHSTDYNTEKTARFFDSVKLEDCLRLFTEPEVLTPQEAWYCPQCKEHREATKQISLWRLPTILVIQLKRFSFRNIIWRDKIDRFVDYPITGLDISEFYCRTDYDPEFRPIYDLYAVVNHYGGMFGGHYTAICNSSINKEKLGWRLFDDSRVESLSEDSVVNRNAYMLLYKLRE